MLCKGIDRLSVLLASANPAFSQKDSSQLSFADHPMVHSFYRELEALVKIGAQAFGMGVEIGVKIIV